MKLAAALSERSDLMRRISEMEKRLANNAKVQEGEAPAEAPDLLLKETDGMLARLEELVTRINLTNAATDADGEPLTALLARRDCLGRRVKMLRTFLDEASARIDRYSAKEIKVTSTVNVREMQTALDRLSKELRQTDERIQEINWTTELS